MAAVRGPGVMSQPGAVAVEPARRRVRVLAGGLWVADSDNATILFEHGFTPRWYLPRDDVRSDLLRVNGRSTDTLGRGPARWYDLQLPDRVVVDAAWDHPDPPPGCPDLDGLISFEWNLMDAWFEEDDEIFIHPRDPYTRVDVLTSSRHVRVELQGTTLADTTRPLIVLETTGPTRYYIPSLDVNHELLVPSESFTGCPYKGRASYWHVRLGDTLYRDLFWSYPQPFQPAARIAGHLCAFTEFVDITVDGVAVDKPETKWTYNGPNAYTFRPGDQPWDPTSDVAWHGAERSTHR